MLYRVILDCRPTNLGAARPFITVKFVDADTTSDAIAVAVDRTKALMREKGFADHDIAAFEFLTEAIEPLEADDAVFETEQSFAYYSDD